MRREMLKLLIVCSGTHVNYALLAYKSIMHAASLPWDTSAYINSSFSKVPFPPDALIRTIYRLSVLLKDSWTDGQVEPAVKSQLAALTELKANTWLGEKKSHSFCIPVASQAH